ncbi:PHP domain-containing protein [Oceanicella actignis]|uniref:PHP domain-containing protein n=1 Tax=Oceanicella actignis TaxID=1189325 RepID=UPI0011E639D9|nr:hypothetical protein [Oceanicella actignis]TYO83758.1 hypothetical protein LY05_02995 [Oceanicella actignis]
MTARHLPVALHVHSTWSFDGRWGLPAIARIFGALGYRAVMMTEHDSGFDPMRFSEYRDACRTASNSRCRLIPGIEYSSPDNDIHILTWGLERFLGEHRPVSQTLADVRASNGVAVFAHPARRDAWRRFDRSWIPLLSGIEIWNRKTDGFAPGADAIALWKSTGLPATVGVDFHRLRHAYPLALEIKADPTADLEHQIIDALRHARHSATVHGRRLIDENGALRVSELKRAHRAETVRRILRDLVRVKAKRRSARGGPGG